MNNREKFDVFNSDFNAASDTIELADGSKSNLAKARGTAHIKLSDSDEKMCKATLNNALFIRVGKKPAFIRIVQAAGFYRLLLAITGFYWL